MWLSCSVVSISAMLHQNREACASLAPRPDTSLPNRLPHLPEHRQWGGGREGLSRTKSKTPIALLSKHRGQKLPQHLGSVLEYDGVGVGRIARPAMGALAAHTLMEYTQSLTLEQLRSLHYTTYSTHTHTHLDRNQGRGRDGVGSELVQDFPRSGSWACVPWGSS